jgi:hypothetical protein
LKAIYKCNKLLLWLDRADPGGSIDMLDIIYDEKMNEYGAKLYFITAALMPCFYATRRF